MSFKDLDALIDGDGLGEREGTEEAPVVLVVDDDAGVRNALRLLLGQSYRVRAYATAQEGVAAVDDEVCAAILDVKMKGYDGFWACNQIRQKYPDLPVIFYSAYQDLKDPFAIINEHRPFGYITKDDDVKRILETVALGVRIYRMGLENKKLVERLRRERKERR
jgi:DNA-binding NtrC family response regulator